MCLAKRQAGGVYTGPCMDPHLCVLVASLQLQGFLSPPCVLAGRRKEIHLLQGIGAETEEYSRNRNSRYTSRSLKDSREPPSEDPDVNFQHVRISCMKKSRKAFWTENKDGLLSKGIVGEILPCRSCVKCKYFRFSSRKSFGFEGQNSHGMKTFFLEEGLAGLT